MRVLLVRHGDTEAIGRYLAGRRAGLHLTDTGRRQAARLPARLARQDVTALYSSPLERARETAEPVSVELGLDIEVRDDLTEMDFGDWTGLSFEALEARPEWQRFNRERALAGSPGGERLADVQSRAVAALEDLGRRHRSASIALVSHAEIIRSVVLHYLGVPLDHYQRIEVSAASVTTLDLTDDGPRFLCINDQDHE
jgi:probable phosphoglycerate mutase